MKDSVFLYRHSASFLPQRLLLTSQLFMHELEMFKYRNPSIKITPDLLHIYWIRLFVSQKLDCANSCNINKVIRSVLNCLFYFIFFYKKILQVQKSTKPLTANKNKKIRAKNILGKKSHLFAYLRFVLLLGCVFKLLVLLMLLVRAKSFRKKIKSLNGPKKLVFVSSRLLNFFNCPNKLVFVRMYEVLLLV